MDIRRFVFLGGRDDAFQFKHIHFLRFVSPHPVMPAFGMAGFQLQ
jgi:hypothetical protein